MMNRKLLLAASAVAMMIAGGAQAQVQMPGWFGSLTGWYYYDNSNDQFNLTDVRDNQVGMKIHPGDGWGGRAYLGYRFSNPWDVAVGFEGSWLSRGKSRSLSGPNESRQASEKADYWLADLEVGHNSQMTTFGYRLFAGIRYVQFDHRVNGLQNGSDTLLFDTQFRGIGPRIGASGAYRFAPTSNWSVFGDVAVAYLFGKRDTKIIAQHEDNLAHDGSPDSLNVNGQLGIAYEVAPNVNLAVGYRADYWSNVTLAKGDMHAGDGVYVAQGGGDRLMHGPFVRVSYNIGAPRPAPVAPVAPAPAAVMTKNFIVFFDFDRSNLTGQAQATIREAAAASKTGGTQRVNVTGHADKSGTDQYNLALSLRRANTVKDELVRNGVPANAIVVVARGESQPLVPTADGVREPQNRRVEIVLN